MSNGHSHSEHFPGPIHNPPVIAGEAHKDHAPHAYHPKLQHHFDDMAQQLEASTLGMWVFLVTEIMFFGGLFMAYLMYRWANPTRVPGSQPPPRTRSGAASTRSS